MGEEVTEEQLRKKFPNASASTIRRNAGPEGLKLSPSHSNGPAPIKPAAPAGEQPAEVYPSSLRGAAGVESSERELHRVFEGWLRVNELSYLHSRMDRKSTIAEGWPDFTVIKGNRVCCVEFKHGDGQLSDAQKAEQTLLTYRGTPSLVTNNVKEAIEWVRAQFDKDDQLERLRKALVSIATYDLEDRKELFPIADRKIVNAVIFIARQALEK